MRTVLLAAAAVIALAQTAHASVIPTEDGVTPDGSDFKFEYTAQLAGDQGLTTGDKLVIVDFAGYVAGSIKSVDPHFTASVSNTLPAGMVLPDGVTDNASIPDLIVSYTGPNLHTTGGPYPGLTDFDGISALSTFGGVTTGYFSATAIKNDGVEVGTTAFNTGNVGVPGPMSAVPEPASWALMILGFLGLGSALRLRRGRTLVAG